MAGHGWVHCSFGEGLKNEEGDLKRSSKEGKKVEGLMNVPIPLR